jgi:hypothetical protein
MAKTYYNDTLLRKVYYNDSQAKKVYLDDKLVFNLDAPKGTTTTLSSGGLINGDFCSPCGYIAFRERSYRQEHNIFVAGTEIHFHPDKVVVGQMGDNGGISFTGGYPYSVIVWYNTERILFKAGNSNANSWDKWKYIAHGPRADKHYTYSNAAQGIDTIPFGEFDLLSVVASSNNTDMYYCFSNTAFGDGDIQDAPDWAIPR